MLPDFQFIEVDPEQDDCLKLVLEIRQSRSSEVQEVTVEEFVNLLIRSKEFALRFSKRIVDSPFKALRLEFPPIFHGNKDQPLEFVLVSSPELDQRKPNPDPFLEHFQEMDSPRSVKVFPNLSGHSQLIVPSPQKTSTDQWVNYHHLASFLNHASEPEIILFWKKVGEQMRSSMECKMPIWPSTAGGGVPWLHFRFDPSPKYYCYVPYRRMKDSFQ